MTVAVRSVDRPLGSVAAREASGEIWPSSVLVEGRGIHRRPGTRTMEVKRIKSSAASRLSRAPQPSEAATVRQRSGPEEGQQRLQEDQLGSND
jgi:hypothetical protein